LLRNKAEQKKLNLGVIQLPYNETMKKSFLVWLILELSLSQAIAQNNLPPVYEIKTDTAANITLDNAYWQMLEDTERRWTIDEVSQSPVADKFHASTTKIKGVDYYINTFWLRYHFKNSMGHEARITIPRHVTHADLYTQTSSGKWNHKMTGTKVPWSERSDLKRITSITYTIQPGEELMIYERYSFSYSDNGPGFLEINFGFTDKVIIMVTIRLSFHLFYLDCFCWLLFLIYIFSW
jgi:two-component system, NtrC family, sensor kinase